MSSAEKSPEDIRQDADAARAEVERTMDALQDRLSVRNKLRATRGKLENAVHAMSPPITTMIRLDHGHATAALRRYRSDLPIGRKRALVANVCLALEIHAQLEEEVFYPALREVAPENETLRKSEPEHAEMRTLIESLRSMDPREPGYDGAVRALMRTVLHHVADEESELLPLAEERLGDRLTTLGWQMTQRRVELLTPHLGEATITTARTFPLLTAAAIAGVLTLGALTVRAFSSRTH